MIRKIDFIIQAILLFVSLLFFIQGKALFVFLGISLFFLGCWQLVSSLINTVVAFSQRDAHFLSDLKWYGLALLALVGYGVASWMFAPYESFNRDNYILPISLILGCAMCYAFVYYKKAFSKPPLPTSENVVN